jgi:hypothetical protein
MVDWGSVTQWVSALAAVTVAVATLFVLSRGGLRRVRLGRLQVDFDSELRDIKAQLPPTGARPEDRQYALQREYHARGLAQSSQSFWFSLLAATAGFIVIVSAIVATALDTTRSLGLPTVQLVSGTIIEAVSALFFVQSNKARQLMATFFDKLREDRKFEEALALAREVADGHVKQNLCAALALRFAGSDLQDLAAVIGHLSVPVASAVVPNGHASDDLRSETPSGTPA